MTIIAAIAFLTETVIRKKKGDPEAARKLLHFVSALLAGSAVYYVPAFVLTLITFVIVIITYFLVKRNIFKAVHPEGRKSLGIFYFPLAYFALLPVTGNGHNDILFSSFLILAVSDPVAALTGKYFGKSSYKLTGDIKTAIGSAAFFISSALIFFFFTVYLFQQEDYYYAAAIALASAAVLTTVEALFSGGSDNFFIPLFAALLFYALVDAPVNGYMFITGVVFGAIVALASYNLKFLTASGSAATFLLASFVYGFGGWKWTFPILTFFALSSVLSKVREKIRGDVDVYFEKSGVRDYMQVLANGGIGGILVILNKLFEWDMFYIVYLGSLAAATADTWATETGTMRKAGTYNILTLKRAEQGESGAVSFPGTLGAAAGALVIALSSLFWIEQNVLSFIFIFVISGLSGSFVDSLLGASFQRMYRCPVCGKNTERKQHCGRRTIPSRGIRFLNNDAVNIIAGLTGALSAYILYNSFYA